MATPKIIPYTVKLRSVVPEKTFSKPPVVYTNDLRSAEFQFKITDMDASELLTATAKTMLYMRDGSFFQNPSTDVSRVGNVFSYLLKENEGNHAGIAKIQLVVYFNEGLANEQNFPTQLYEFEIINGLETKVAQEVMIYDWTTLTREARAYIDEFTANEILREAEFDNNEFDRNTAFVASQDARTLAFGTEQTNRGTAFTAEQNERTTEFNESESGRTTAESGRVTAESNRVTAESGRVTKESQRVTAESSRVTAESGRVTAESGRVTAENARATTFSGYNARITGMETDVNANGTNGVTNGDFSNGTSGWTPWAGTLSAVNKILSLANDGSNQSASVAQNTTLALVNGNKYYVRVSARVRSSLATRLELLTYGSAPLVTIASITGITNPIVDQWYTLGGICSPTTQTTNLRVFIQHQYADAATALSKVMELQNAFAIDLTATFGKGSEPTIEQMDGILAKFTNSWFDGTKNLFRANAALNKLMAVDGRTEFEAKNSVLSGDFADGTKWGTPQGGTLSVANNTGTNTADGTTAYSSITQSGAHLAFASGKKLYLSAKVRVTNSVCQSIYLDIRTTSLQTAKILANPAINQWYVLNGMITSSGDNGAASYVRALQNYADAATAAGKVMEVQYFNVIDLTAAFGAGKEPTLAEMDRLMERYPNRCLDGVKPIQTIETLYQEKANKVQEAWITPTLQNGATGDIQYRKNQQGRVEFRGSITFISDGLAVLTMPVGYRLAASATFSLAVPSTASTTSTQRNMFLNGGANWYPGYPLTARTIDFTGLSYVAEQ